MPDVQCVELAYNVKPSRYGGFDLPHRQKATFDTSHPWPTFSVGSSNKIVGFGGDSRRFRFEFRGLITNFLRNCVSLLIWREPIVGTTASVASKSIRLWRKKLLGIHIGAVCAPNSINCVSFVKGKRSAATCALGFVFMIESRYAAIIDY